jgi:hypothetical protein
MPRRLAYMIADRIADVLEPVERLLEPHTRPPAPPRTSGQPGGSRGQADRMKDWQVRHARGLSLIDSAAALFFGILAYECVRTRRPLEAIPFVLMLVWRATSLLSIRSDVRRATREERRRRGCCGNCGYDLRAAPGRCPECGAEQAEVTGDLPQ